MGDSSVAASGAVSCAGAVLLRVSSDRAAAMGWWAFMVVWGNVFCCLLHYYILPALTSNLFKFVLSPGLFQICWCIFLV